jgi:uncharacterized membrane protein SirB2
MLTYHFKYRVLLRDLSRALHLSNLFLVVALTEVRNDYAYIFPESNSKYLLENLNHLNDALLLGPRL